jgi:hypothetical protein
MAARRASREALAVVLDRVPKGISPGWLRVTADGRLVTAQTITADGTKRPQLLPVSAKPNKGPACRSRSYRFRSAFAASSQFFSLLW